MRFVSLLLCSAFLLAACVGAPVPDSGAKVETGTNFSHYQDLNSYRANREDALLETIPSNPVRTSPAQTTVAPTQEPVDPNALHKRSDTNLIT